eukprot:CAMPEP_0202978200 /NCGR_PEP_ID=MMETSP1396-20130829/84707_1 /ASSEMBLY_ACC=CAM_ASM_000872 /TAXON_ID= /ORGANISM="Pseudokeronopsis sp., Strain Brazil" /LENGTH=80 /DNA_ID=CAMNT_0049717101 /DNA_START=885 /DNA_END=1127 /DNA_ORIENTATION=-
MEFASKSIVIDTGSSYILAPLNEFLQLILPFMNAMYCGFMDDLGGMFVCSCTDFEFDGFYPDIKFVIDNTTYTVTKNEYI